MNDLSKDRLIELLADQTIFGLSAEEQSELEQLKKQVPDWEKDFSLELTAAAINLSDLDTSEELPVHLRTKILENANEWFESNKNSQNLLNFEPKTEAVFGPTKIESEYNVVEVERKPPFWQWLSWGFAAVACIALAVNLWLTRGSSQPEVVKNPPTVQTPTPKLSPEEERAQMLAAATDAVKIPLSDPKNAQEVLGEMVWSNNLQKGYLRFRNLPANDVAKETYQLWIVDASQNPKTPINGGVFDIATNGETIIPVDPELTVKKPLMIAVTVEKPGGVVVSAQEKVVALAKI